MSDVVILGSESPSADVLVYDKDVAYFTGKYEILYNGNLEPAEMLVDGNLKQATYEFVGER